MKLVDGESSCDGIQTGVLVLAWLPKLEGVTQQRALSLLVGISHDNIT